MKVASLVVLSLLLGVSSSENNFDVDALKLYISDLGIKFPKIVYAQAVVESGNFESKIFLENNNLFGMKVAKSRPTTAKGERNGYAYYDSWQMSVIDYALYQSAYARKISTESGYYEHLGSNYAESGNDYIKRLKDVNSK
jgi:uncharacterized FlgJ-related protein